MPLPRFQKLEEAQQRTLLGVATREFAEHGYEGASFNRIIATAGVSKGAMYYYFADKADLYRTVVGRALDRLGEAAGTLEPFDDAEGYWSAISALSDRAVLFLVSEPEHGALGRAIYDHAGGVLDDLLSDAAAYMLSLLEAGQTVGAIRTDVPLQLLTAATTGLLTATDRWFAEHWEELDAAELAKLSPKTIELCRDLLSPKASP